MMIDFLLSLPWWALAVVLNIWLIGFALASLWALRRWVLPRLHLNTNASLFYAAAVMQSVMVLYGLVAALTAVSVWSKHSQASDIVSREATAIASLWRDLGGYPQRERDSMREVLRDHTNQIIHEAWPEQRHGRIARAGVEAMDRFLAQLLVFEPTSESQKLLHAETLSAYNRMHEARRQRWMPWTAACRESCGLFLCPGRWAAYCCRSFSPSRSRTSRPCSWRAWAGFVAMVRFVIISLDRPMQGVMAIPADSYQLVYDQFMKR